MNGSTFMKARKTQIQDNNDIILIESENEIPLLEYSENIYQLMGYDINLRSKELIIKNLVHASPEQLYFEGTTTKKNIYSHIYI